MIKSRDGLVDKITETVVQCHPYDVPEVIATRVKRNPNPDSFTQLLIHPWYRSQRDMCLTWIGLKALSRHDKQRDPHPARYRNKRLHATIPLIYDTFYVMQFRVLVSAQNCARLCAMIVLFYHATESMKFKKL